MISSLKKWLAQPAFGLVTVVLGLAFLASPVQAAWPEKTVRIIVPGPPGSAPDSLARMMGQKLSERWGQAVTVDNIVGASGNIGTDRVAKATPDGYTLLFNTMGPTAVNYTLMKGALPYDPLKDLMPISLLTKMPNILVVNSKLPVNSLQELIELAKKEPGKLRYGTAGTGTTQHLSGELLNLRAGVETVGIPYKSSAQMTTDAIGGQIEFMFHNAPVVIPHIKAGSLKALAITSDKRSPSAPEIPTMAEAGLQDFEITAWFGFMAPGATPKPIIQKIAGDIAEITASPEIRDRILSQASEPIGNTPEQYTAFLNAEVAKWRDVITQANIKPE
jgi:tripartite-type tricarboxylate transporter receptor subunit TctC